MLVLSRKIGEEIVVDDRIRVRVLSVEGRCVKVGLVAPLEVPIRRAELEVEPFNGPASAGPAELVEVGYNFSIKSIDDRIGTR